MLARLGAVMIFTPTFVLPALVVAGFGGWLGQLYIKAQLSVKREMSTAKAPVLGILGGAIAGLRTSDTLLLKSVSTDLFASVDPCLQCSEAFQDGDRKAG